MDNAQAHGLLSTHATFTSDHQKSFLSVSPFFPPLLLLGSLFVFLDRVRISLFNLEYLGFACNFGVTLQISFTPWRNPSQQHNTPIDIQHKIDKSHQSSFHWVSIALQLLWGLFS